MNMEGMADGNCVVITGEVISVLRFDSGYAVVTLGNKTKLTGQLGNLTEGAKVAFTAKKVDHPKYGKQYQVVSYEEKGYSTTEGIANYLCHLFRDIGYVTANLIVSHFGASTLEVIDENPKAVESVPGIQPHRAKVLSEQWKEKREENMLLGKVMSFGFSANIAKLIIERFNDPIDTIVNAPYDLVRVRGLGFKTVDKFALSRGIPKNSSARVIAAIEYVISAYCFERGHTYIMQNLLSDETITLLEDYITVSEFSKALTLAIDKGIVVFEDHKIFLSELYEAEKTIANKIFQNSNYPNTALVDSVEEFKKAIEEYRFVDGDFKLSEEQIGALFECMQNRVCIITGGPGTGKSTISKTLCRAFEHYGVSFKLCSPTGKAAKRLRNASGYPASTIHRLLEYDRNGNTFYNKNNPLNTNCLIIDESSMIDVVLLAKLLESIETRTRIIFVGDANQLPPVGPGNPFKDLIEGNFVTTIKLNKIFRQDKGSSIIGVAHDVIQGIVPQMPSPKESKGQNCMFISVGEPETFKAYMMKMITEQIPKIGVPVDEIQVLAPMKQRGVGTEDLNPVLQEALNPPDPGKAEYILESKRGDKLYRVGDRVMQIRNDYNKDVFNGDSGVITEIKKQMDGGVVISVKFADLPYPVSYEKSELGDIMHCWAITVHKSQGSEFDAVIMVCHPSQMNMLQRNLFYTGITRAKKLCVVMGTTAALDRAVKNDRQAKRYTNLNSEMRLLYGEIPLFKNLPIRQPA